VHQVKKIRPNYVKCTKHRIQQLRYQLGEHALDSSGRESDVDHRGEFAWTWRSW